MKTIDARLSALERDRPPDQAPPDVVKMAAEINALFALVESGRIPPDHWSVIETSKLLDIARQRLAAQNGN